MNAPQSLTLPAPDRHTVTVDVDAATACVSVHHHDDIVWGQCGSVAWALACAAKALQDPTSFRRWWNEPVSGQ